MHDAYAEMQPAALKSVTIAPGDNITRWALDYLSTTNDRSLKPMLEAALARKYSGNPGESFFTAGGLHHFENFEPAEDGQMFTVAEGFQHSVNLVFIRLMRDIEHYYMYRVPGAVSRSTWRSRTIQRAKATWIDSPILRARRSCDASIPGSRGKQPSNPSIR